MPVPYTSRLLAELIPGQTLTIHGNVLPDASRFEINLLSDCTEINPHMGSVPLHVGVRFDEGKIVLNSFNVRILFKKRRKFLKAGEWDKEERHSNPFTKGQPFDIRIRVHDERLEILANQQHLADFKHRIFYTKIDHLQVLNNNINPFQCKTAGARRCHTFRSALGWPLLRNAVQSDFSWDFFEEW